jgi:hypothetical protein
VSARAVLLLVDAANVVGSRPDGWWRDRAGAAGRLVARLPLLVGRRVAGREVARVVVVLEGRGRDGAPEGERAGVTVRHAPADGDDLLADLCGSGVLLVTADRELARRARAAGAEVIGPRVALAALDAANA